MILNYAYFNMRAYDFFGGILSVPILRTSSRTEE